MDHGPRGHDDQINAVAGAVWLASKKPLRARVNYANLPRYAEGSPYFEGYMT